MITTLHVLSIGTPDAGALVRDVLVLRTRCRLYVATSTWDLSVVLRSEGIDVAILHNTFSRHELRDFAAYIRLRWPFAKILLIQDKSENLDYAVCDERIDLSSSPEVLMAAIERLGASARRARRSALTSEYNYQQPREDTQRDY